MPICCDIEYWITLTVAKHIGKALTPQGVAYCLEKVAEIVSMMIVRGDYDDLSGKGFLKTLGGNIIRYDNNVIWGGGNIEYNNPAGILETNKEPINGTVYKVDKNLIPTEEMSI